ncbi:MAG: hypothetical protein ABIB47_03895 [Candidatus Woesearchaeota archaeon]
MKKSTLIIFLVGILVFLFYAWYSYSSGVTDYISDSVILIGLLIVLFLVNRALNLSNFSLILVILGAVSHLSGVFGWYNASPFILQYDHVTHLVGLFAISAVVFDILKPYFGKKRFLNFVLLLMIFFASLGIGSIIEQVEYVGYLKFGTGAGLLRFGGLGDTPFNEENLRAMDIVGGGWINTMLDLNYNFLGALAGTLVMYLINKFKLKKG